MFARLSFLGSCLCLALGLFATAGSSSARAEEPFQAFLDALRERQYFDAAMDYLAEMSKSNLITPDVKSIIPYEEGRTLIDDARVEKDPVQKGRKLDAGKAKLEAFVNGNSANPLTPNARMQLGNVIVERGRMQVELAHRPTQLAQKPALLAQARGLFDEALKVFTAAEENFNDTLSKFPKFIDSTDKAQIERRDQARRDAIQSMLYAAATLYEKAKTFELDPKKAEKDQDKATLEGHKKGLQEAADKYEKIYQAYRTRLAGLLARIKQGQCYQEMGDTRRALGYYADILSQPDDLIEFRKLKASALYLSLQCWNTPGEKKYELAHTKGDEWLRTARGVEDRQADWLAIRYYTAYAMKLHAEQLDPDGKATAADAGKAKNLLKQAYDHAQKVAKVDGPYEDPAKALMKELNPSSSTDKEPTTFVEATERGKLEFDGMNEKNSLAKEAQKDPAQAAQVAELVKGANEHRANAQKYFELALSLRESDSDQDEVTNCRYYLCYLRYMQKQYYDAAVIGEFIARNYPDNGGARQAAKIALASYLQEYNDKNAPQELRQFDRQQMLGIAEYCAKRWPTEEETLDNWAILMAVAVGEHDMKQAETFIARVPEDSPRRADSELKLGQAYWTEYLTATQKEDADRPQQAELEGLLTSATGWLEKGMSRMKAGIDAGGPPTLELLAAALSASQIYVTSGQSQKGLDLLNAAKYGPLTLCKANDNLVKQHDIEREVYKVALRAYVATSQIDQATEMMNALQKTVEGDADAAANLTKIYISMGRALEEQVKTLRDAKKTEELTATTKGFEAFLTKIGDSEGNTFASLNWVAESYYSLGAGYDVPGAKLGPEAKTYYEKTLAIDDKLLARKDVPSPDALVAVKLRKARCLRRLSKFKDAVDLLELVLKEKSQLLDAQTEAAVAYMDWGAIDNPLYFNLAMYGARKAVNPMTKREENTIWGWVKMGNVLGANPQFEKQFHESRINVSRCMLAQANAANAENKFDKKKLLNDAYQNIRFTTRFKDFRKLQADHPEIYQQYDDVLKTIQKAQGQTVGIGLKPLIEPQKAATGTAPATTAPTTGAAS